MPDYDFRTLSPIDFEVLCRDLLNADLGLRLVSFAVGPDGGIDLRDPKPGAVTIAQCKHRPDIKKDALVTAATKEAARWKSGDMDQYLFVVSSSISPGAEVEIADALEPLPVTPESVWHRGTLNAALGRQKNVEKDHIKLWLSSAQALETIANASQWQRSEQLLQRVSERVKLYVHTPAFAQAMKVLAEHHLVMISGAPGVGKSTLAEMILLSLWKDGWTVVNIASDIDEAWRQIHGKEDKVIFYYDDFLGQTSSAELQKNEGSGVALLIDQIRRGSGNRLLVLTTREQVLRHAGNGDDDRVRRISEDHSKLRIELSEIGRRTKAEMMFNHLYFGFSHDPAARAVLASDSRYRQVIDHQGFNPRILESITLSQRHDDIDSFYAAMLEALDHPEMIWAGSFEQLSDTAVKILFQLATSPSGHVTMDNLRSYVLPTEPKEWVSALKVLDATWIRLHLVSGAVSSVSLFDPSRRDFLLDVLDDQVYFDSVLDSASSLEQVAYLYRLAGLFEHGGTSAEENARPALRACAKSRLPDLESIIVTVARGELDIAERLEKSTRMHNERIHALPLKDRIKDGFEYEDLNRRITTMIHLSFLCFSVGIQVPAAEALLRNEMEALVELLDSEVTPSATDLFILAANLTTDENRHWTTNLAISVTEAAFANIDEMEDVNGWVNLPDWFTNGVFHIRGSMLLNAYFEGELESLCQHDDRDNMLESLETLESISNDFGVYIDVESTREYIERHAWPAVTTSGSSSFSYPNPSSDSQPPASNGDLSNMFARLKD